MQEVYLKRAKDTGKETTGILSGKKPDGKSFSFVTLELPWKNNTRRISCVPAGTYLVKWTYMPSHKVWHYCLQNVPGRDGIFIHSGAYHTDFLGCIGLGYSYADFNKDGQEDIVGSRNAIAEFEAIMNKQDFTLTIEAAPALV